MSSTAPKTAIIGMGKTGQSVARFLLRKGMACEAFDESPLILPEDIEIVLHTGALDADVLKEFECLIVSPGLNWLHPVLVTLRQAGIPVFGDLQLFSEAYQGDLIAITGTNGKTTTVSLISTMLDTLSGGIEAGGNIGVPMLDLLGDGGEGNPDMQAYEAAKLRLFARQGDGDKAMIPGDICWNALVDDLRGRGVFVRRFGLGDAGSLDAGVQKLADASWQVFWHHYDEVYAISSDALPAQGVHQHLNLAVAAPDAAGAALRSFHQVVWICGGLRKGLDVSVLKDTVAEHVEQMYVIGAEAKPFTDLATAAGVPCRFVKTVEQAVKQAVHAVDGVPVLLSPAAASQDQFRDYMERGNVFAAAVASLEVGE